MGRLRLEGALYLARQRDGHVVQLTTDRTRSRRRETYESLGFRASQEGSKLQKQ